MSASLRALALLASLASVASQPSSEAYTAPPAPAFTCCTGSACTGGVSNDAATCAALGELYAATAGANWSLHTCVDLSCPFCVLTPFLFFSSSLSLSTHTHIVR